MRGLKDTEKQFGERNEKQKANTDSCAICMDDFDDEAETVQLKCAVGHIFHTVCIRSWFYA
jgi:hypothetical protein